MISTDIDNQKYLELAEMILVLGNSKDHTVYEKHKFMTMLFFLKQPIYLEKLVSMYSSKKMNVIDIKPYEKYNLLYEESRVSLISPKSNHLLSYLLSREMIITEFTGKGFMFKLKSPNGLEIFKKLKKNKQFKNINARAKAVNSVLGKKDFDQIKQVIIDNFKELKI